MKPKYSYNKQTEQIELPADIEERLLKLNKILAMKEVMALIGAGLRIAKDYLDALGVKKLH